MTSPSPDNSALRVLVIDDQEHVRHWVHSVLKRMDITNITDAADGREALAAVTEPGSWFDLILCDLRMPGRDGIETIRAFAALGIESAFVIMSVEEERILETAGVLAEVQGLRLLGTVPKPVTPDKLEPLLARIRNIPGKSTGGTALAPESDMLAAFNARELTLMYQPKVSFRSGTFSGAEALVRWKHPTLGLFQPAAFIPIIEESDDYSALLTDFCLTEAIACAGRWTSTGQPLSVAINLSPRAFERLDLPERVESLAKEAGVMPDHITLEVTETQIERDAVRMIDVATRLRLKGFRLSIDDFGTGQSGLAKLQTLPFNELKIDRRFVDGCASSAAKRAVVQASLALSQSLKMVSVAEGVQQRPDWELLSELGCDVMQGFFIARPMSEDGLAAWAAQWAMRQG